MRDPVSSNSGTKSPAPDRQPAGGVWGEIRLDPAIGRLARAYLREATETAATLKARMAALRSALVRKRKAERRREAIRRTLENYPATTAAALALLYRVSVRTVRADLVIIRRERNGEGRCPACGSPLPAQTAPNKVDTIKGGGR